ncbi:MAG: glycoside hydrolase family 2, partial [Bacilli bacterium]|nr:glycoside hydrolase family 2 [Bacilli bacterium]
MVINSNWKFYRKGEEANAIYVDLPYDAMFREERNNYWAGDKVSFFDGADYVYEKELDVPAFDRKTTIYIEIEGAYHDPSLYINGELVHTRHYGYADFYVDVTNYIKAGEKNVIRIETINSDQPNSRWYSGGGLYRDVSIYYVPETHILPRKFGIRTKDYKTGEIEIRSKFSHPTTSHLVIKDGDGNIVLDKNYEENDSFQVIETIQNPNLWSINHPYLYTATLSIDGQDETIKFGIRQIELSVEQGLLLNGEKTILYGACIHSDNGLLGAETYPDVERRKIEMLKKAGYNSIRSAHNPIVKSFLDAADELGLLVMDEYVDCWFFHKTKYDYAQYAMDEYKQDLLDIVDKDFSHPSVILYSTGNEVAETAFKKGIDFTKTMTDYLHELDDSRPVTCGINVFFDGVAHAAIAEYSEGKAEKQDQANKKAMEKPKKAKREGSSDIFNDLATIMGASFMANGARIRAVDRNTKDAFANLDIAGYNY